jgi:RNA polymerase sigma factor (sigma-70 family)
LSAGVGRNLVGTIVSRQPVTNLDRGRDRVTGQVNTADLRDEDPGEVTALESSAASAAARRDDGIVDISQLVRRAALGDRSSWEQLVSKYSRLIWAMTRDFKLTDSDAADVVQATWLRLLEHIDRIEHPDRIGSWLATTARHECLRHVARRKKVILVDDDLAFSDVVTDQPDVDERLIADESAEAVRQALSRLPWRWQRLLELLMTDPPASYAEISSQLGLPVGSIGPTRGRCLERLRVLLEVP